MRLCYRVRVRHRSLAATRRKVESSLGDWLRLIAIAVAVLAAALPSAAHAQSGAFAQMRSLIEQGYYNSAARLNGPELVRSFPDDPEAHFLYARALYLTGDLVNAQEELDAAISLSNESVPAHAHLQGLLRAANGDADGALRLLRNAFLRTSDYLIAMDWGRVAWQAARYSEALEAFDAAASTTRGFTEMWPHLDKGRMLMLMGRPSEAIPAFESAIDVFERTDRGEARPGSPAYVEAYYRLGEAHEALGDIGQAETHYRAARSADPNYGPAISALDRLSREFP